MKKTVIKIKHKESEVMDGRAPSNLFDFDDLDYALMGLTEQEKLDLFEKAKPFLKDSKEIKGVPIIYGTGGDMRHGDFKHLWDD